MHLLLNRTYGRGDTLDDFCVFHVKPYLWKENSYLGDWGSQLFYKDEILHVADIQPPGAHQLV